MKKKIIGPIIAMLVAFGALAGCEQDAASQAKATEASEGAEPAAAEAKRVEVKVDGSGYDPDEVVAKAGQPLELVFTRVTDEGCGDVLAVPDYDIEKDLPLDEPVEVAFTPESQGEIAFTCGMGMYDGKIVVQ